MTGRTDRRRVRADRSSGRRSSGGRSSGTPGLRWRPLRALGSPRLLTPARAGGLLGMLAAGLLLKLVTGTAPFGLARIDQPTLQWTASDAVLAAVAVPLGSNVFEVDTAPIEASLRRLPTVADASVTVSLPSTLMVRVTERTPILVWRVGDSRFLVDAAGVLFASADPGSAGAASLPTVIDDRTMSATLLAVGGTLDPVDLDVATRLASLVPADIGSAASHLAVHVDDESGFTIRGASEHWTAIFGWYSTTLRSPDIIPSQVQLLRSLLSGREDTIDQVILAGATTGTYTVRATPKP
ncbi:MAG TPA: FtsQ-type POTRA domain-containing protein [Candidatus Limnocylindrales bacterium]|nr:FtsQ-type POTRA domain-containing protein [Candidatus Limnocylindrales bacterium]